MKIALITNEFVSEKFFAGGIANYLFSLCLSLIKLGHQPEIFVPSSKTEDIIYQSIKVHRVQIPTTKYNHKLADHPWVITSYYLNQRLSQVHHHRHFDIAQYANWMATGLYRIPNLPSVIRLSSLQSILFNNSNNQYKINTLEEKLEYISLKKADAIYGPSNFLVNIIRPFFKSTSVIETPFILDTKDLDYKLYLQYFQKKNYILFYGQINATKGIVEIEKILLKLLKRNPLLYFAFIGDGPTQSIVNSSGQYHDRIITHPPTKHSLLYPIIKGAKAIILPSRIDNLPNTCLESMGLGKIIIASKNASFEQLITSGKNGFLVNPKNSMEFIKAIEFVLKLSPHSQSVIESKAKNTIKRLAPQKVVSQLITYYQKTISEFSKKEVDNS